MTSPSVDAAVIEVIEVIRKRVGQSASGSLPSGSRLLRHLCRNYINGLHNQLYDPLPERRLD